MAKFCSNECKETGSMCDFCKHYLDYYTDGSFDGDGICDVSKEEVSCTDGYDCDDFECTLIGDN